MGSSGSGRKDHCSAVMEKFDACYTRLQGEKKYPMTTPKPVPTAIDLHMQCVDSSTTVGKMEEQYLRQSLKLARVYQVRICTVLRRGCVRNWRSELGSR